MPYYTSDPPLITPHMPDIYTLPENHEAIHHDHRDFVVSSPICYALRDDVILIYWIILNVSEVHITTFHTNILMSSKRKMVEKRHSETLLQSGIYSLKIWKRITNRRVKMIGSGTKKILKPSQNGSEIMVYLICIKEDVCIGLTYKCRTASFSIPVCSWEESWKTSSLPTGNECIIIACFSHDRTIISISHLLLSMQLSAASQIVLFHLRETHFLHRRKLPTQNHLCLSAMNLAAARRSNHRGI